MAEISDKDNGGKNDAEKSARFSFKKAAIGTAIAGGGIYSLYNNDRFRYEFSRAGGAAVDVVTDKIWPGMQQFGHGTMAFMHTPGGNQFSQYLAAVFGLVLAFGGMKALNATVLKNSSRTLKTVLGVGAAVAVPLLAAAGVGTLRDDPHFDHPRWDAPVKASEADWSRQERHRIDLDSPVIAPGPGGVS